MALLITSLLTEPGFHDRYIVEGWKNGKKFDLMVTRVPLRDRSNRPVLLRTDAAEGFMNMMTEAAKVGFFLDINYAYRSHKAQRALWRSYQNRGITNRAARPGWSTHQSGLSVDISGCYRDINNKRYKTTTFWWLKANGPKFGFYNDVPSEPWHWTFFPNKIKK